MNDALREATNRRSQPLEISESPVVSDVFLWASSLEGQEPKAEWYCSTMTVFQSRLSRMERELFALPAMKDVSSLIVVATGEIGNNSFDHNIGNCIEEAKTSIRGCFAVIEF